MSSEGSGLLNSKNSARHFTRLAWEARYVLSSYFVPSLASPTGYLILLTLQETLESSVDNTSCLDLAMLRAVHDLALV